MNNPKCFFCSSEAIEQKKIIVGIDVCHDVNDKGKEIFTNVPMRSLEWVCPVHLEDRGRE